MNVLFALVSGVPIMILGHKNLTNKKKMKFNQVQPRQKAHFCTTFCATELEKNANFLITV